MVVEKARNMVSKLVELWPIVSALIWLIWATASWHAEVMDKFNTQENQIIEIQNYLRHDHDHQKGSAEPPTPGVSLNQTTPQQDAAQPLTYNPQ